jgi:hypothetical protein
VNSNDKARSSAAAAALANKELAHARRDLLKLQNEAGHVRRNTTLADAAGDSWEL